MTSGSYRRKQKNSTTVMFGYPQPIYRYIYHIDGECESIKSTSPKSNPALPPSLFIHTYTHKTHSLPPPSINQSNYPPLSNTLNLHPAVAVALCVAIAVAVAVPPARTAMDPFITVPCDPSSTSQCIARAPGAGAGAARRCRRPSRPEDSWA